MVEARNRHSVFTATYRAGRVCDITLVCRTVLATAIVLLSVAGGVLFGQGSSQIPKREMKITPVTSLPQQNIGFELPELPGEEFRIVIPELISDLEEPILPWSTPSPKWEIGDNLARCLIEIPHEIRMEAEVRFLGEEIRTTVRATNLSERSWQKANAFTCFAFYAAPLFDDPQLTRTYFPVNDHWKSIADLFAAHNPGEGPYTFFRVAGGPPLEDYWVCRKIQQNHPQLVSRGCAYVISKDGQWVAGMTTHNPAYLFHNRRERCIHADPLMGTVPAGGTAEGVSTIYILRGMASDFIKRCD
jgi:hypothetical protein